MVSVDAKKKERIGNYKNAGKEWRRAKAPHRVNTYDFIDNEHGAVGRPRRPCRGLLLAESELPRQQAVCAACAAVEVRRPA